MPDRGEYAVLLDFPTKSHQHPCAPGSAHKDTADSRAVSGKGFDLSDSSWYLNRELTWLEFNCRVLHEAEDQRTPLLERLKFIAIFSSNLDEFFMKRMGGLKQQISAGVRELTLDGRTPAQQVMECHGVVRELGGQEGECLP